MSATSMLANVRGETNEDYRSFVNARGYVFIVTPSHGFLCLGSDDNGYSDAIEIARRSNYSYILDGGLVYLEEDCDAGKFLELGLTN